MISTDINSKLYKKVIYSLFQYKMRMLELILVAFDLKFGALFYITFGSDTFTLLYIILHYNFILHYHNNGLNLSSIFQPTTDPPEFILPPQDTGVIYGRMVR